MLSIHTNRHARNGSLFSNSSSSSSNVVKIERSTGQSEMAKNLRYIAKPLSGTGNLFGEHIQVVARSKNVFKDFDRVDELFFLVHTSL
jgi:hypothetical protein